MISAEKIMELYNMKPLPGEGGYYVETYRSGEMIGIASLPDRYKHDKSLSTAIYYMLTADTQSNFHRLPTDEIYHFYMGDPVVMIQLHLDGTAKTIFLGHDLAVGQFVQVVVPRNVWQGSYLLEGGNYALMGTTMAPGFDCSDHEIGDADMLTSLYPMHKGIIERLTP